MISKEKKKQSGQNYFARPRPDKEEWKLFGEEIKHGKNTTDVVLRNMMACLYRSGERICLLPRHKLHGVAKAEETERKRIESEEKKRSW